MKLCQTKMPDVPFASFCFVVTKNILLSIPNFLRVALLLAWLGMPITADELLGECVFTPVCIIVESVM